MIVALTLYVFARLIYQYFIMVKKRKKNKSNIGQLKATSNLFLHIIRIMAAGTIFIWLAQELITTGIFPLLNFIEAIIFFVVMDLVFVIIEQSIEVVDI